MINLLNYIKRRKTFLIGVALLATLVYIFYRYYYTFQPILMPVFSDLLKAYFIAMVWWVGKYSAANSTSIQPLVYGKTILFCAFLAFIAYGTMGTHMENADPLFGGGDEIIDFVPTDTERLEYAWRAFFVLVIPALCGVYQGMEERRWKKTPNSASGTGWD
jgi:hypothetical protein